MRFHDASMDFHGVVLHFYGASIDSHGASMGLPMVLPWGFHGLPLCFHGLSREKNMAQEYSEQERGAKVVSTEGTMVSNSA